VPGPGSAAGEARSQFPPPMIERPSLLVLVRHAESARNVAKKGNAFFLDDESRKAVQGIPDHHVPITDEGRRQAELTGQALRRDLGTFDYVYHSGYRRTQETAEHLLAAYTREERDAMRVRHHLFLRERDAGWTYDMTTAEAASAFPWLQGYWETFGRFYARPPGGESFADVAERVYLFLSMLFRDRAGRRVLIVSHGGTLRVFRHLLERWTQDEFLARWDSEPVPNCAVTSYAFDAQARRLVLQTLNAVHWRQP
jgi:2,3-bisphosphoglycerate-dependent phosphoglycerate mutase